MRRDPLSNSLAAASFGRSVRWRICTIGSVHWSIALSVPLGYLAVLLLMMVPATIDVLDHTASIAWRYLAGVWLIGLGIQSVVTQALFSIPLPTRHRIEIARLPGDEAPRGHHVILSIGGVWMAIPDLHRPPDHPRLLESFGGASRVLALWSLSLLSIGVACLGCLAIDAVESVGADAGHALAPTAAIAAIDRPWVAASWIFCLQGCWQLLPLPQSLGRVGWSTVIGLFTRSRDPAASDRSNAIHAMRQVQWWLVGMSAATLVLGVLAIHLTGISSQPGGRAWPALSSVTLLALWMFVSSRGDDLLASQLILAANGETGVLHRRIGIRPLFRHWQAARRQRERTRKLLEVAKREREEASDAARVDEILQRLHASGRDSLSAEERAILSRVSEAIRQERARDQDSKNP